jgi:hypothetical protein
MQRSIAGASTRPTATAASIWRLRAGDAIHLTNLGRFPDVLEKLAIWCSENDRE